MFQNKNSKFVIYSICAATFNKNGVKTKGVTLHILTNALYETPFQKAHMVHSYAVGSYR